MKFVAAGDNCIDWYFLQDEAYVGGCSLNVSVYLSQMGEKAAYLGGVGREKNGMLVRDKLNAYGVDTTHLHVIEGKTAVTKIELVNNERTFRGYDEGVLAVDYIDDSDIEFIRSCDYMHTSVYGNCEHILRLVEKDVTIVYDFAYKLKEKTVPEVLRHIHYGFFSYERDDPFIRNYLKECWEKGGESLRLLVATLGSEGSLCYDGKEYYKHEIVPVKPVDTMGAGDSFIAGFLSGLSRKCSYRECMNIASEKARETVLKKGAFGE